MEALTKRIIAIVLIAVIGIGVGVGVWFFLSGEETYSWSADDCPGAPTDITADQIIRIGVISDTERIQGEGSLNGANLAAKEINEDGGITVDGKKYYVGIVSENTDEGNPLFDTAIGVTAAKRLINYKRVQYAVGTFRTECALAYQPIFMDKKVILLGCGAATTSLGQNVLDDYERFKYWFQPSPQNTSILIAELIQLLMFSAAQLSAPKLLGGLGHNISRFAFMREDVVWTAYFASLITPVLTNNSVWNMTYTGVSIAMPQDASTTELNTYWDQVEAANTQIVIPIFSGQAGVVFSTSYGENKPKCIPYGINVESQDSEYWNRTAGKCNYGITMESAFDTNKTPYTQPFLYAYRAAYGVDPIYTATGAYDNVKQIVWAIEDAQSFDPDDLVAKLESIKFNNPRLGAGGGTAYTASHANFFSWPMGIGLAIQWVNGTKTLVPGVSVYPSDPWSTNMGPIPPLGYLQNMTSIAVPDWGLYYFDAEY